MKQRIIKFRAWDKNKMTKPFDLEWLKENTKVPADFTKKALFSDTCIFQQYTGLKDKNSKEIYGGDIVKNGKGIIYEVKFYNFGFNLDTPEVDGEWMHYTLESYEHIHWSGPSISSGMKEPKHYKDWHLEVIGNIYENKDLLKNEN